MRTTQFVGLNNHALSFVSGWDSCPSDNSTEGMFGEKIPLSAWTKNGHIVREIVQETVWSSGPMIFTCIESNGKKFCKWIRDYDKPFGSAEYNEDLAVIYV